MDARADRYASGVVTHYARPDTGTLGAEVEPVAGGWLARMLYGDEMVCAASAARTGAEQATLEHMQRWQP